MRSTKLKRKLLAGILCAAMVFQSIPMEAVATEAEETVQYYDNGDQYTTEEETQAEMAVLASSEVSEQGTGTLEAAGGPSDAESTNTSEKATDTNTVAASEGDADTDTVQSSPETVEESEMSRTPVQSEETETAAGTVETSEESSAAETVEAPEESSVTETAETPEESSDAESAEITEEAEETEWTQTDEELMEFEASDASPTETETVPASDPPEVMNRPDYNKLLSVVTEKKYYFYDTVEEIFLKMEGCEIPAEDSTDIDIEMYIDEGEVVAGASDPNKQVSYDVLENGYYRIPLGGKKLSEGIHKLRVKFKDVNPNSSKVDTYLVVRDIEFEIEKVDNVFTEAERYFLSSSDDTIEVAFFNVKDDIESVKITASNGDIVARSGDKRSEPVLQKEDPRYTGIGPSF